ncbi:amidase [Pseudofrankia sp. BMG5.36]|uniref:amidase n=1 Tax=Pseudofrankia sp. BMG5.36 TaxID=1834512 RepID=UPI0008DB1E39|nr:amidase [Pseudofrankia sp. BMG5.36]OHV48877.1 amidase [Pseudofrankia sp. BMG5.36]
MDEYLTITEAAAALRSGATTSVALTSACFAAADAHDGALGVYLARFDELALAAAAKADEELAAGVDRGPLHGIPLGVKDIIAAEGGPTTAQSLILDPAWGEGIGDAVVVARLRAAGAVITGKSSTMEFATGMPDPEKPFPIPRNPWNPEHWAGGSSSGTGSGVAAGMFLGGLGTDTGGSIRCPSAFNGITGLKQTFGRVPKSGCVPLGYSYDHIGPMARSARDCAIMLGVMAGHDPSDATSVDMPVPDYTAGLTGSLEGVRIGVDLLEDHARNPADPVLDGRIAAALEVLREAGATLIPLRLPFYREARDATIIGAMAEALAYHRTDLAGRWADYGAATRAIVATGTFVTGADYVQVQRFRRHLCREVATLFGDVDLIATPTAAAGAPRIDELGADAVLGNLHTQYWNSTGHPALSIPIGLGATGLPLALQLVGRPFGELAVLDAGHAVQRRTDWHLARPPLAAPVAVAS